MAPPPRTGEAAPAAAARTPRQPPPTAHAEPEATQTSARARPKRLPARLAAIGAIPSGNVCPARRHASDAAAHRPRGSGCGGSRARAVRPDGRVYRIAARTTHTQFRPSGRPRCPPRDKRGHPRFTAGVGFAEKFRDRAEGTFLRRPRPHAANPYPPCAHGLSAWRTPCPPLPNRHAATGPRHSGPAFYIRYRRRHHDESR